LPCTLLSIAAPILTGPRCSILFFGIVVLDVFFECVARVPVSRVPVSLGVWGLRLCAPHVAQPFATVRNRPQPPA
jgi:hypothetical protein